jgi:Tfp pilus assembly protein PilW
MNFGFSALAARSRHGHRGFTLVELMMAGAIGMIILAGILTAYIMSARSFRAIANYWEIHSDGRHAIDRFATDMRGVSAITQFGTNGPLVVRIPVSFNWYGSAISNKTVTYTYSGQALYRSDTSTGSTAMIATNVYKVDFRLFDKLNQPTTLTSVAKGIRVELFLRKYTAGVLQSEDYLSASFAMRNKP